MRRSRRDRERSRFGRGRDSVPAPRTSARSARLNPTTEVGVPAPRPASLLDIRFEMTVGAFLARQRSGALHEGPRAELVAGTIVPGASLDPSQAAALVNLSAAFARARLAELGVEVLTWAPLRLGPVDLVRAAHALVPGPAFLDDHERGARWARRARDASTGIGGSFDPAGTLLVVEALRPGSDLHDRLARYAAAEAPEVWLLDVRRGWIESFRSPWRREYRSRTLWYPGEAVPISTLRDVAVEALVPP